MPKAMQRMWKDNPEVFIVEATWGKYKRPDMPEELGELPTVEQMITLIVDTFKDMELSKDKQWILQSAERLESRLELKEGNIF